MEEKQESRRPDDFLRLILQKATGWHVSDGKIDGIRFEAKKDVIIVGILIFEQVSEEKGDFTLGYKYSIEDA